MWLAFRICGHLHKSETLINYALIALTLLSSFITGLKLNPVCANHNWPYSSKFFCFHILYLLHQQHSIWPKRYRKFYVHRIFTFWRWLFVLFIIYRSLFTQASCLSGSSKSGLWYKVSSGQAALTKEQQETSRLIRLYLWDQENQNSIQVPLLVRDQEYQ